MKQIPGYSRYMITKCGVVYSLISGNPKVMRTKHTDRYDMVTLFDDDKQRKTLLIHRLVALTYIPNPLDKSTVNHKDGIKTNNHMSNLEWLTQAENQAHADKVGLNKVKGIDNPMFKPWYYIVEGQRVDVYDETINDFCNRHNQEKNYSNVKRWCRENHTLSRGYFGGYTFGYC